MLLAAEELHDHPRAGFEKAEASVLSINVVQVNIGEPTSEGFGPRRYTTYRITSDIRENYLHSYGGGELALANNVCVRRRFSDFLKLRSELLEACPGVIVPPLPEKQAVGRFDPEFVEKRRRALSSFLASCASHPVLATTPQLATFCEWHPALRALISQFCPTNYIPTAEAWARTDGGDPFKSVQSALADIAAFEAQARKLREVLKRDHVRELERSVDLMELAQAYGSFGQSDFNFGLRPLLSRAAQTMGGLSTLSKLQAEADQRTLLALLKEYKNLAAAIAEQCKRRELAQKAVEQALSELRAAQTALGKATGRAGAAAAAACAASCAATAEGGAGGAGGASVLSAACGGGGAAERKAADLEAKVAEVRARAEAAQAALNLRTRTLSVEIGRFHAGKDADFRRVLRQVAIEHATSAERVGAQWKGLLQQPDPSCAQGDAADDTDGHQRAYNGALMRPEGQQAQAWGETASRTAGAQQADAARFGFDDASAFAARLANGIAAYDGPNAAGLGAAGAGRGGSPLSFLQAVQSQRPCIGACDSSAGLGGAQAAPSAPPQPGSFGQFGQETTDAIAEALAGAPHMAGGVPLTPQSSRGSGRGLTGAQQATTQYSAPFV